MQIKKKSHKKPFYKELLTIQYNLLNKLTLLKLKKKKWKRFQFFSKLKLRFFKRYRFQDQSRMYVTKFTGFGNKFKKYFKNYLIKSKRLKVMYGGFKKKGFKKAMAQKPWKCKKRNINNNISTLLNLEQRLDSILYKVSFCKTVKQAKQFICHGHVLVNDKFVRIPSLKLKPRDRISISTKNQSRSIVKLNIVSSRLWPLPPSYLKVNYRTLDIINLSNNINHEVLFFKHNTKIGEIINNAKFK